jgi:hypothetical protein
MPSQEPSLRQQLNAARANVERQIDKLQARPYPLANVGAIGALGGGFGAPFQTNGVMIDNAELIARLTTILHEIDEALAELGPGDA